MQQSFAGSTKDSRSFVAARVVHPAVQTPRALQCGGFGVRRRRVRYGKEALGGGEGRVVGDRRGVAGRLHGAAGRRVSRLGLRGLESAQVALGRPRRSQCLLGKRAPRSRPQVRVFGGSAFYARLFPKTRWSLPTRDVSADESGFLALRVAAHGSEMGSGGPVPAPENRFPHSAGICESALRRVIIFANRGLRNPHHAGRLDITSGFPVPASFGEVGSSSDCSCPKLDQT